MRKITLTIIPLFLCGLCSADDPILVINNGGHTATVRSIAFTRDGRSIVSAGDDRMVRIWDAQTGQVQKTIWGQIGPGIEGTIYGTALSPDNRILAVAGWMPGTGPRDAGAIRLYSFPEGAVTGLLQGATNVTESVAFSPDSRLLASGSADNMVRIWDVGQKKMLRQMSNNDRIHTIAFSGNGAWLAWGTLDGNVRVWSLAENRMAFEYPLRGGRIVSVAFSPDSRYLAAVDNDTTVRAWDAAARFQAAGSFRGGDPDATAPANMSFTPDGRRLLVTSHAGPSFFASIMDFPGGTVRTRFSKHNELIVATAISPDGSTAITAGGGDNEIYLWDTASGSMARKLAGAGAAIRAVAFSQDGRSVAFGTEKYAQPAADAVGRGPLQYVIHLADSRGRYHVGADAETAGFVAYPALRQTPGLSLNTARNGSVLQITRGGAVVTEIPRTAASGYRHLSYAFTPDGRRIVSGGLTGALSVYSADNGKKQMDFAGHTGAIWAVGVSADGRTLVSGSDDQTVRLWDLNSGKNLLSFFLGSDREWVAWTPEGYYASSLNGDKYVGWLVNQGSVTAALYYSVARFQKTFYRPDVVSEQLKSRDITVALHLANVDRGQPDQPVARPADIAVALPPLVYVAEPENNAIVRDGPLKIRAAALSNTLPIKTVKVLLDGQIAGEYTPNSKQQDISLNVPLPKGPHVVTVVASNGSASSEPVIRNVTSNPLTPVPQTRPSLIFLAIGISKYRDAGISLQYADEDARALQALIVKQQNGPLFDTVKTKLLLNSDATREGIITALNWLQNEGTPNDVRILFLAGHGELSPSAGNSYFFSTYNHVNGQDPEITGVRWNSLLEKLQGGKGKAILMVDTCHAAAVSGERGLSPVDLTEVIKNASQGLEFAGVTYYTASQGSEYSFERPEWKHGAFTKALLEGIEGKAVQSGPMIQSIDLGSWVSRRVLDLTEKKQHPAFFSQPGNLPPFPIFAVR